MYVKAMATARRLTRAEAKARTRARLLRAAADVFAEKGFLAATVEEISEAAGFTRGAFYGNFTSKADVLVTILEEEYATVFGEVADLVATSEEDDKLPAAQDWFERVTGGDRLDRAVAELWPEALQDPDLRARLARRTAAARDTIAAMISAYCREAGIELPAPVEHFAAISFAIGVGLENQRRLDPDAVPADLFAIGQRWAWAGMLAGDGTGPG